MQYKHAAITTVRAKVRPRTRAIMASCRPFIGAMGYWTLSKKPRYSQLQNGVRMRFSSRLVSSRLVFLTSLRRGVLKRRAGCRFRGWNSQRANI